MSDCRCCDGLGMEAPRVIENRPGLSALAYRIGTHSRFKATMLARLSAADLSALNALTTRSDTDFSIAFLDACAAVADVLAFYQERIANEVYVRTATERGSLVKLASLIGYLPRPGIAASTHLAFTIEATSSIEEVPVPAGTRVQSIPGPGELPQVFETLEALAGRDEFNAMRPLLTQRHPDLSAATRTVTIRGIAANVSRGDSLLIVAGATGGERTVKRVFAVTLDTEAQTTRIDLDDDPPAPPPLQFFYLPYVMWNPTPAKLSTSVVASRVMSGAWRQADLHAYATVQNWSIAKLSLNLFVQASVLRMVFPPSTGVFAFRQRAAIFGHNAPKYSSLPATQRFTDYVTGSTGNLVPQTPPYPSTWENNGLDDEPGGTKREIDLDTTYPRIVKGSWLVLEDATRRDVYRVEDNTQLSRADYTLSGKVSRIKLDSSSNFSHYGLRTTSVLAESERLELAELPVTDVVKGNRIVLDRAYLGLTAGRAVAVSGARADLDGVADSEIVGLADVLLNRGCTELVFETALENEYERRSVTVNANVALASHGEARELPIGSGDTNTPFQEHMLPEGPLTHVPARTPTGGASTLEVRLNGLLWEEVDFLYGHGPDEHVYATRDDEAGRTHVRFGDGRTGARLPTGQENVHARYRKGMGAEGLVRERQLTLLQTKPLGVRDVVNPVAAGDAAEADGPGAIRRNAALPIRTLDRIVSLRDYEDFARAFSGIAKALATWTWNGHHRGVFVTIAGDAGKTIAEGGLTHANLMAAIAAAADAAVPVRARSYTPAFFRIAAGVSVDPAHQTDVVLAAVEDALRAAFAFAAREFGQPVAKSEVVTAMQLVPGVVAVDLDELQRIDITAPPLADALPANTPRAGTDVTLGAELLLLDPRPVALRVIAS